MKNRLSVIVLIGAVFLFQETVLSCQPPCLYAENGNSVFTLSLSNDTKSVVEQKTIKKSDGVILSLALDIHNNNLYWSDGHYYTINKARLDGANATVVHDVSIGIPLSLSVDPLSESLYWLDFLTQHVEVSTSMGKYRKILRKFKREELPIAFIADTVNGYLFWSIVGNYSRIVRTNLAGENATIILSGDQIHFPTMFVIDYSRNRLVWLEHWKGQIMSSFFDGSNVQMEHELPRKKFKIRQKPYFYGLAYIHATEVYYVTEFRTNAIYAVYRSSGNETEVKMIYEEYDEEALVAGIVILEKFNLTVNDPCEESKCSQLCIRTTDTDYICSCSVGYTLHTDGKTCLNASTELEILFADSEKQSIYHLKTYGHQSGVIMNRIMMPNNHTHLYPEALTFDPMSQYIYWTDLKARKTFKVKKDGSDFQTVNITHDSYRPSRGLAIASKGQLLFWFSGNKLKMSSINGDFVKTILTTNVYQPRDIVVHEEKGLLFFADQWMRRIVRIHLKSGKTDYFRITREYGSSYGGYRYLYTKATGLAIDYSEDRLYYCDDASNTLESVNLDFSHHRTIFHKTYFINGNFLVQPERAEVVQPFSIAIWRNEVFWTDLHHEAIFRANKRTGTHIEYITGGLKSPKDIFVTGNELTKDEKVLYTIKYHLLNNDHAKCYNNNEFCTSVEIMDPAECPPGYNETRVSTYCGKCSDTIGTRFVCSCDSWETCGQRQNSEVGACRPSSPYMFFKIRECTQAIKPGYCPYYVNCSMNGTTCFGDNDCDDDNKCCHSNCGSKKCAKPLQSSDHPCLVNNGGCSHFCMALEKEYYCECPDGMQMNKTDKLTCQDIPPPSCPPPCLYASNDTMLFRIPLNKTTGLNLLENGEPQEVFKKYGIKSSLEVDPVNKQIFWADIGHQTLNSSSLDGKNVTTLFEFGIGVVKSISVDPTSKMIYWVDSLMKTVDVAMSNGKHRKVLFRYRYDYPMALVADYVNGYLFISVWGDTPRIEQSNLDGSNHKVFLTEKSTMPTDLSVDSENHRLYWFDLIDNHVESIDFNGTDRKMEIKIGETHLKPNYVAYSHRYGAAYFWHHEKYILQKIYSLKKNEEPETLYKQYTGFSYHFHAAVAEVSLLEETNLNVAAPCLSSSNKCSQLCLKVNDLESTCACATGFTIDPSNETNCLPIQSTVEFVAPNSKKKGFDFIKLFEDGLTVDNRMFPNTSLVKDIAYNSITTSLYWIDRSSAKIIRSGFLQNSYESIIENINADDIYLDETSNLLAVKIYSYIYLYTMDGKSSMKLAIQLPTRQFLSIAVPYNNNPVFIINNGALYYSLPYGSGLITKLDLFTMETKTVVGTRSNRIHVNAMAACNIRKIIFYLDSMTSTLQSVDFDLSNRKVVRRIQMHFPSSMKIFNETIYYVDTATLYSIDISGADNAQAITSGLRGYYMPFDIVLKEETSEYDTIYHFSTIEENSCINRCDTVRIGNFDDPKECPPGYTQHGEVSFTCHNCSQKLDERYVCPCRSKETCAQRVSRSIDGCSSQEESNLIFKTRECKKEIKAGYCPYDLTRNGCNNSSSCISDNDCSVDEKCCSSGCPTMSCQKILKIPDNPCYQNVCSHLCVAKDSGFRCLCPENMKLDTSERICVNKTENEITCSLKPQRGNCRGSMIRYYFNTKTDQCEKFKYSGCGGNENNFRTEDNCFNKCQGVKDICALEKDPGPCQSLAEIKKWYFDDNEKKCSKFSYGGCKGNKNKFDTEEGCKASCSGVCPAHNIVGTCVFDENKACQNDTDCVGRMLCCSKGCGKECTMPVPFIKSTTQPPFTTATPNVCLLAKKVGPCEALIPRWFYNIESNQCESFNFGGCSGNGNNFETKEECENKCPNICTLEKETGPCRGSFQKWFYNSVTSKCETFVYGGCQGNANNFDSSSDCEKKCTASTTTTTQPSSSTLSPTHTSTNPTTSVSSTTSSHSTTKQTTETTQTFSTQTHTSSNKTSTIVSTVGSSSVTTRTTPRTTTASTSVFTSVSTTTATHAETSSATMTTITKTIGTSSNPSTPGPTVCTPGVTSEGCVCPGDTGGPNCQQRADVVQIELQSNSGKKVSESEIRTEIASALTEGCRDNACKTKTSRKRRTASDDEVIVSPEDIHIISFEQNGKTIIVTLFARLKDNTLISKEALLKIFEENKSSFGKSIGVEIISVQSVDEAPKEDDKKRSNSKLPIVVGIIVVILLVTAAVVFLWKKKMLCKKPFTPPVMKWTNNNDNYNNLDAQAQDVTPAVEGYVNPVYTATDNEHQVMGAQRQPMPVDNIPQIEKKEQVDMSNYVQPQDEKIPISDFIEPDMTKPIPEGINPYFNTADQFNVLAGMRPPEYSSRPNTAQGGRLELPPYVSRVDIRQNGENEKEKLEKEILDALEASYAKEDKKGNENIPQDRTFSTVSLRDSGNFNTPFLPSEDIPENRSFSSVSLRDSGNFQTPFLAGEEAIPQPVNRSVTSIRSITVGENTPDNTPDNTPAPPIQVVTVVNDSKSEEC